MKRFGSITKVRPELVDKYVDLHANAWPGVLDRIKQSNIQNYSIFLNDQLSPTFFTSTRPRFSASITSFLNRLYP